MISFIVEVVGVVWWFVESRKSRGRDLSKNKVKVNLFLVGTSVDRETR